MKPKITIYCAAVVAVFAAAVFPRTALPSGFFVPPRTYMPPPNINLIDVNGDGKSDLIFRRFDNRFMVARSTGSGFETPQAWVQEGGPFLLGQDQYADVNGDGKQDLIFQTDDNRFLISLSTDSAFTAPAQWMIHGDPKFIVGQAQYADVNGDGKADLIYQSSSNMFWVSLSDGHEFTSTALWLSRTDPYVAGQAQNADVNGDGKADLIYQDSGNKFWIYLSSGTGFSQAALWATHNGQFKLGQAQYADVNGDGKADLIFQTLNNGFWVSLSNGSGFDSAALWEQHGGEFDENVGSTVQYADITGDKKADLILQGYNEFWLSPSDGSRFQPRSKLDYSQEIMPGRYADTLNYLPGRVKYADVNGDEKADLVVEAGDGRILVSLSNGSTLNPLSLWITDVSPFVVPLPPRTGNDHVKYVGYYTNDQYDDWDNLNLRDHSNLAFVGNYSLTQVGRNALYGRKSLFMISEILFCYATDSDPSPSCSVGHLRPDYQERWSAFAGKAAQYANNIGAFYLFDEPYYWLEDLNGMSRSDAYVLLQQASAVVKASFPQIPVVVVETLYKVQPANAGPPSNRTHEDYAVPDTIDWAGFDCYNTFENCAVLHWVDYLKINLKPSQSIVLVAKAHHFAPPGIQPTSADQTSLMDVASKYRDLAISEPRVAAVFFYTAHTMTNPDGGNIMWGSVEDKWGTLDNTVVKNYFRDLGKSILLFGSLPPLAPINYPPPPSLPLPTPAISYFSATPTSITSNQSSVLSWSVTGADSISINQGIGNATSLTTKTVSPTQTTIYTLTAANSGGSVTASTTVTVTSFASVPAPSPNPSPAPSPSPNPSPNPNLNPAPSSSSVKLINSNGTFYLIKNSQRQGVTNPGMLFSYGFEFKDAVPATTADQALPEGSLLLPSGGSLVKSKEDPTVYLISQGQRYGFVSAKVFTALGFKFSSVLVVTNPELQALPKASNLSDGKATHLPGIDINKDGTIYWFGQDNFLHGYPSLEVYNSWHKDNDFSQVVLANAQDNLLPVGEAASMRILQ